MEDVTLFSNNSIDWCYSCAETVCRTGKQKMFAWIVIQLLRQMPLLGHFHATRSRPDDICFTLKVSDFYENSAIEKYIARKSYWKFVTAILKKQFIEWGITDVLSYKTSIQFYKEASGKSEYIEFWFHPKKELY